MSPLWERAAAAGYNRVRSIPVKEGFGSDWKATGYFAVTHGMDIDLAYLGRVDGGNLEALRKYEAEALATGTFEQKTIYLLDLPSAIAAAMHAGPDDLIVMVDKRIVLLPGGASLGEGLDRWPFESVD